MRNLNRLICRDLLYQVLRFSVIITTDNWMEIDYYKIIHWDDEKMMVMWFKY